MNKQARELQNLKVGIYGLAAGVLCSANALALSPGDWPEYSADKSATKFSDTKAVTAESVKNMQVAWVWDMPGNEIAENNPDLRTWVNETTPLAIDGILYTTSPLSIVSAVDGSTGKTIWTYDPKAYLDGTPPNLGFINRGLTYWEDGNKKRLLATTADGYLLALDASSGELVKDWGNAGKIDLTKGLRRNINREFVSPTTPPIICGGTIIPSMAVLDSFAIGRPSLKYHPPGDVRAYDLKTGKKKWIVHSPPIEGELGNETWENGSWENIGGANVWTKTSCDEEKGLVYLPFSTPTNDFYGGERKGDGVFGESIVALHADTGKIAWYYQIVHHGIWDYDLPTAPVLMDLTVDGKKVEAVAQPTKQGWLFVFDRNTGEPVWPIEERAVAQSDIPGEFSSPTQPFPSKPAAVTPQGVSEDDLIDLTPELKQAALKILKRYNHGPLYTPPTMSKAGTLQVPGVLGGISWAGPAFNPNTNIMYVPEFTIPFGIKIKKENAAAYAYSGTWAGVGGPDGLPLLKPPFSSITAIDMNTGEHLWKIPAGKGPVDHPAIKHLKLDRVGIPRQSHITLTNDVLFVAPEGTNAVIGLSTRGNALITQATKGEDEAEPYIYAHSAKTGDLIAELKLPGAAFGGLMSYTAKGKHYVIVPTGGAGTPARLIAVQVSK